MGMIELKICPNNVDLEVIVDHNYCPGEKEVLYDSNMTGTPGSPAWVEILAVWHNPGPGSELVDIGDYLDAKMIENIELQILNKHN